MVEEVTSTEETTDESVVNPIDEARAADIATEEAATSTEETVAEVQEVAAPETFTVEQMNTMKTQLTQAHTDLFNAKAQLRKVAPLLVKPEESKAKLTPEQIEARLKEFVADPDAFMEAHTKKSFDELSKAEIDPLRGEISSSRTDSAIQQFMREHPELGKEGEKKLGAILDAFPHLTQVGKNASAATIRLKLEDALGRLVAQDPAGYAASVEAAKQGVDPNIQKAKAGAAGLGNKTGSIAQTSDAGKDEFDAVLDLNNAAQARFAGRG